MNEEVFSYRKRDARVAEGTKARLFGYDLRSGIRVEASTIYNGRNWNRSPVEVVFSQNGTVLKTEQFGNRRHAWKKYQTLKRKVREAWYVSQKGDASVTFEAPSDTEAEKQAVDLQTTRPTKIEDAQMPPKKKEAKTSWKILVGGRVESYREADSEEAAAQQYVRSFNTAFNAEKQGDQWAAKHQGRPTLDVKAFRVVKESGVKKEATSSADKWARQKARWDKWKKENPALANAKRAEKEKSNPQLRKQKPLPVPPKTEAKKVASKSKPTELTPLFQMLGFKKEGATKKAGALTAGDVLAFSNFMKGTQQVRDYWRPRERRVVGSIRPKKDGTVVFVFMKDNPSMPLPYRADKDMQLEGANEQLKEGGVWDQVCPKCGKKPSPELRVWSDQSKCPWCGAKYAEKDVQPNRHGSIKDEGTLNENTFQREVESQLEQVHLQKGRDYEWVDDSALKFYQREGWNDAMDWLGQDEEFGIEGSKFPLVTFATDEAADPKSDPDADRADYERQAQSGVKDEGNLTTEAAGKDKQYVPLKGGGYSKSAKSGEFVRDRSEKSTHALSSAGEKLQWWVYEKTDGMTFLIAMVDTEERAKKIGLRRQRENSSHCSIQPMHVLASTEEWTLKSIHESLIQEDRATQNALAYDHLTEGAPEPWHQGDLGGGTGFDSRTYSAGASDFGGRPPKHPVTGKPIQNGQLKAVKDREGDVTHWEGMVDGVKLVIFND